MNYLPENIDDWDKVDSNHHSGSVTGNIALLHTLFHIEKEDKLKLVKSTADAIKTEIKRHKIHQDEVQSIQPFVRTLISVAIQSLGKRGFDYSLFGTRFERTTESVKDPKKKQARVYFPFTGSPDIEIQARNKEPTEVVVNPDSSFGFLGPPAVIEHDIPSNPLEHVIKAGTYALFLLFRVFPMLQEDDLLEIFPDRFVYTIVVSDHQLVLVKVDVNEFITLEKIPIYYSKTYVKTDYVKQLAAWVAWACTVAEKLLAHVEAINGTRIINSWVPARAYREAFGITDPLKAYPSFYNPMYRTETHYYRICQSFWCGNDHSKLLQRLDIFAHLFEDHVKCRGTFAIGVPDYGIPLCKKKR
ncbi:MAG: hypothetical protein RLY57_462, partial [Candidatus Parcubacteria bacterium]